MQRNGIPLMNRPNSIVMFEGAYLASVALSAAGTVVGWPQLLAQAQSRLPGMAGDTQQGVLLASSGLVFGAWLLLWFLIARRASNAAKWILVVITAIGLFRLATSFFVATTAKDLMFGLDAIATLLGAVAVWQLFKPDSVAWLEGAPANDPASPASLD